MNTTHDKMLDRLFDAYLMLYRFPSKSIFLRDDEWDYSSMPEIEQICSDFADDKCSSPWLYLWSDAKGTGKSILAARSARRYAKQFGQPPSRDGINHLRVPFQYVPELLVQVRDSMRPHSELTERNILQPLKDADFLILDDIGAEKGTEFSARILADLINARSVHPELPTIITANMSLNDLAAHLSISPETAHQADRIVDRIDELAHVIEVPNNNFRSLGTPNVTWKPLARYVNSLATNSPVFNAIREEVGWS